MLDPLGIAEARFAGSACGAFARQIEKACASAGGMHGEPAPPDHGIELAAGNERRRPAARPAR